MSRESNAVRDNHFVKPCNYLIRHNLFIIYSEMTFKILVIVV